jgi:hypothetical protein
MRGEGLRMVFDLLADKRTRFVKQPSFSDRKVEDYQEWHAAWEKSDNNDSDK